MTSRLLALAVLCLAGCRFEGSPPPAPGLVKRAPYVGPQFEDVTARSGLGTDDPPAPDDGCDIATYMTRGGAVGDVDGDGHLDLVLPHPGGPDLLYLGTPSGFVLGELDGANGAGALLFDADGDGDLDLFVTSVGLFPPRFYDNDGGRFVEVDRGIEVGTDPNGCHHLFGASAADFDGDGDLDLFTAAWVDADGSRVFVNDGRGHFTDASVRLGDAAREAAGLVPFPADLDDDGDIDFVLASDFHYTRHYVGRGDGTFEDVTRTSTIPRIQDAMSVAAGDVDLDGDLDLFFSGICHTVADTCNDAFNWTGNRLFLADGDDYEDATVETGALDAGWAWGSALFDADLDGDLDLAVTNGYDFLARFERDPIDFFDNDGTGRFVERAAEVGLDDDRQTRSVIPFDYDEDGDLDLLVLATDGPPRLYENHAEGRALVVRLAQPGPNPYAIGARVFVELEDGRRLRRDLLRSSNYLSLGPPRLHFGLGESPVEGIEVTWPDGETQRVSYDGARSITIER
ncbi:MAG: CRTAC1 family protein [Deltaproteobacteria bacterium]